MIIKRASVKRLRAIKEKTVDFSPGLNIIKGSDNEAGKSSLRIAITKALFQDPTTAQKDIEALTSWGTDEPWEVTLEFDADADSYHIIKSFKDKTGELACTGAHGFVARNKNAIAKKMAELTGCPSEIFFESTACIGQDELIGIIPRGATTAETQDAVGTITKRLQAKLSGREGVDIPALLVRLYGKTHHKDAAGPHFHLAALTERIANLRSQELEQEHKVNNILEKRKELTRAREELGQIDQQDLPAKQELLNKNRKMLELQKEIARDKAQYDSFQRAKELKSKIDNLENELRQFSRFINAEVGLRQVDAAKTRLAELSRQRSGLEDDLKALRRQKPPPWTLVSGLALVVGGLVGLIANPYLGAVAVAGLLISAYWAITIAAWQRQIKLATRKTDELEREFHDSTEKAQSLLNEFGCKDYDEYERRLAEYRTKTEAKRDALNQLEVLVVGKDWQKFVEENADLEIQMSARLKELQQFESFRLEPLSLQKLEQEVNSLLTQKVELEQEKGALEKFLQYTDADKDQLADIEEELKELEQKKEFWERKRRVYDTTREFIEQAHKQTLSKAADLLESDIARYIASITDGKYGQVRIDESDLSIRTFSPEKNDWVDVSDLSRATQDQFYICARLALVRLITEGKRPPILLDDPFVNFHAKRLKKTITLLQEIARENQILLFTCSDSYDYLGTVASID
jgi:DNA repair exonuclease SbcCD ATPase subunit